MHPVPAGVKLRRTWPQRLFIALNITIVLICFGTAGGLAYVDRKAGEIQRITLGHVLSGDRQSTSDAVNRPMNILLVGVDDASGLDPDNPIRAERDDEGVGGLRSDTIMVLHVDPTTEAAALVSFPRDLWVEIGDTGRRDKINAAMALGGPEMLIRTITVNFDIPIDHYVQVDFAQFKRLVDVVDGVRIYFDHPARDLNTGLLVPDPGCVTLDGDQALAYARSRYFEYWDGEDWYGDGSADLGRIERQQDFIKRALRRAVDRGVRNPITLKRLVDTGLEAVAVDDQFRTTDILALAERFRSFDPDELATHALPVYNDSAGSASILRLVESEARPILDIFRGISSDATDPSSVRVRVLNGTGVPGQAGEAADLLADAGFTVAGLGDAPTAGAARTTVRHAAGDVAQAETLSRWMVVTPRLEEADDLDDGVIELVTGADWSGVRAEARPTTTTVPARPDAEPTTTTVEPTTTSRYGIVPGDGLAEQCR